MPLIVAVQARDLRRVRVSFDQAVKQEDATAPDDALNAALYTLVRESSPAVDATPTAVDAAHASAVDVLFDIPLTPAGQYRIEVGPVADLAGGTVPPSDGTPLLAFVPPQPATRAFALWSLLAEMNRREDQTDDLQRFVACLEEVLTLLLADVDAFTDILDPDLASDAVLDLMLGELCNPFSFELSEADKRRLIDVLVDIYRQKGTAAGIKNAVRFFLGIEVDLTAYSTVGLSLGDSLLGVNWILGSSVSANRYSFEAGVQRALLPEERKRLRALVDYMRPAHTHFRALVEPTIPPVINHVELGISQLGSNWLLH
jgi:phage tail-like protein